MIKYNICVKKLNYAVFNSSEITLLVGDPEIQKLEKVAGKYQNCRLYPQLEWCFRSVKTDTAQI